MKFLTELKKRSLWRLLALTIALSIFVVGCASAQSVPISAPKSNLTGSIKITGSNTVTPITTVWAEEFMKANPRVRIAVSGPGSGVGIAALIDGTTDICQTSRPITSVEVEKAKSNGRNPNEIIIAYDGLAIVVNPANRITELTMEQLSNIYSGKITNWKDVGGNNATIVVLSRDSNSGTHVFFKELVVQLKDKKAEYGPQTLFLPSTEAGINEVSSNTNAIFFAGLGYVRKEIKVLPIKKDTTTPGVLPSIKTVHDKTYPVSRPFFFYTDGAPQGTVKAFIDYAISKEGQKIVESMGFVPLP